MLNLLQTDTYVNRHPSTDLKQIDSNRHPNVIHTHIYIYIRNCHNFIAYSVFDDNLFSLESEANFLRLESSTMTEGGRISISFVAFPLTPKYWITTIVMVLMRACPC